MPATPPKSPPTQTPAHPARFSKTILVELAAIVQAEKQRNPGVDNEFHILDPFAGTGRVHELADPANGIHTYGIEIEPEWAAMHPFTQVGDALQLPHPVAFFDMVLTSPTYGNRLADRHNAKDASIRRSYTFDLRKLVGDPTRELAPNNTGRVPFNAQYKVMHQAAWSEVWRVLRPGGLFVLNVSDFVKNKKVQQVCRWHIDTLTMMGFDVEREIEVETPRLRYGRNWESRLSYEKIYTLRRP